MTAVRGVSWPEDIERVLVIGCHADDAEIGCGGTVMTLLASAPPLDVTWVVLAAGGTRADEARRSASMLLEGARSVDCRVLGFRDGFLPYEGAAVKEAFEELKAIDPDLVLTHHRHDLHQDHRLASSLTWNTFRHAMILEYEIPKYDGDLGRPNVFVPIAPAVARRKTEILRECFASQAAKDWFADEVFDGLMRLRGMECRSQSGLAEAFYGRKVVMREPPRRDADASGGA